jgi:hypothetical protein
MRMRRCVLGSVQPENRNIYHYFPGGQPMLRLVWRDGRPVLEDSAP